MKLNYLQVQMEGCVQTRVRQEGLEQLQRYATSERFRGRDNLRTALLIFVGKSEYVLVTG